MKILRTVEDTTAAGKRLGTLLRPGDVVGLEGPLGVGKTTWIRGLAEGLGVDPGYGVTSPTFVYAHIYPGKVPLHHLDFYRLETESRLYAAGLEELIGGEAVTVIEWYDRTCLKINREDGPNLLLYKPCIKYMYKA